MHEKFTTLSFLLILLLALPLTGQTLLEENFDYAAGDTLSNHDWKQIRNGNPITVCEEGLEYPGYILSGIGKAAQIDSSGGQEIARSFPTVSGDSLYVSFLVNVNEATEIVFGSIFLYLVPQSGNIFSRNLGVYVKRNESNMLAFGVNKNSGIAFTQFNYDMSVTHLVVVKYTFIPDTADRVSIWMNPDLSGDETDPDRSTQTGVDADEISEIVISQLYGSTWPPKARIDGIRVSKTWKDATVSIEDGPNSQPAHFVLNQNYPNPFNNTTIIKYHLSQTSQIDLSIFNILGQKISSIASADQNPGSYQVAWNAENYPGGIYFIRLQAGEYRAVKRMVYLK